MLRFEVLTPQMARLAPELCQALAEWPFTLAGGTGLALQLGHRISVDFDWFGYGDALPPHLGRRLRGIDPSLEVVQDRRDTFECVCQGVKCSWFCMDISLGEAPERFYGMPIAPIVDIAAMKVVAIGQRGARKDFFDLHEVLQQSEFRDVIRRLASLYDRARPNPVHLAKALVYFADAEGEPQPVLIEPRDWSAVRKFFDEHVREFTNILLEELARP